MTSSIRYSYKALLVCLLVLCYSPASFARDSITPDTITWVYLDNPPWYIKSGPHKGQGIADQTLTILKIVLPNYTHNISEMTSARWEHDARQGKKICMPMTYKTASRDEYMTFSIPSNILLSARLIIKKNNHDKFGLSRRLSFEKVLKTGHLNGVFEKGRSNIDIDHLLEQHKNGQNVDIIAVRNHQLFRMVMLGRSDYMVEFPFVASYLQKQYSPNSNFTTISIEEVKPYGLVYVSCSKNDWGKKVINDINAALINIRPTRPYRNAFLYWLDKDTAKDYQLLYDNVLLNINE